MNLPAVTPLRDGVSKGRISILIPLTPASSAGQALSLSRDGERESKGTLQRATGNYQVKKIRFCENFSCKSIFKCCIYIYNINQLDSYNSNINIE
jgi:hypothetical protein